MASGTNDAPGRETGTIGRIGRVRVYVTGEGTDGEMSAALARNWWAVALRGVLAVLFGLIALVTPGAVMLSLALFFAAYLLADGAFGIIAALRAARRNERWGLLLAEAVVNIVMGVIAFLFPVGAVLAFVLITAAWAILSGALMLGAALRLGREHGRWWLALGGLVSLVWGVCLIAAPIVGAVVLTWWMGFYAIAFGAMLLVVAFKLRGQKETGSPVGSTAAQGT